MNVVIAGHFAFPSGSASASRVRHFARGLIELGHRVWVIVMGAWSAGDPSIRGRGEWAEHAGVPYVRVGGPIDRRAGLPARAWARRATARRGAAEAVRRLEQIRRRDGVDVVLGYSKSHVHMRPLIRCCARRRIPLVRDVVEWFGPDSYSGGRLSPLYWDFLLSFHRDLPRADGIVAISRFLADHFAARGVPVVRIPAIIDPEGLPAADRPASPAAGGAFHLTYLGGLTWRDGPMLMLRAVRRVLADGHDVVFHVVGSAGDRGAGRPARRFAEADPALTGRVLFHGRVSDEELGRRLADSDALVFTRLSGRAARAAFPTRLPEYLMTARPVIASGVGDIPEYLADGREAIIVPPDSPDALADGIERLIGLPDRGRSIGLAGRDKCRQCFDYRVRCRELAEFLAAIRAQRS